MNILDQITFHPNLFPEHKEFEKAVLEEYYSKEIWPSEVWRCRGSDSLPCFNELKQRIQEIGNSEMKTQVFVSTNQSIGISQLHRDGLRKSLLVYVSEGYEGTTFWSPNHTNPLKEGVRMPERLNKSDHTPVMSIVPYAGLGIEFGSTLAHSRAIGNHAHPRVAILASFK